MRCKHCAIRRTCKIATLIDAAPAIIHVEDCKNYVADEDTRRQINPQSKDLSHRASRIRALSPVQTACLKDEASVRHCPACGEATHAGVFLQCDRCQTSFCESCIITEATSKKQFCVKCWEDVDPSLLGTKGDALWS